MKDTTAAKEIAEHIISIFGNQSEPYWPIHGVTVTTAERTEQWPRPWVNRLNQRIQEAQK